MTVEFLFNAANVFVLPFWALIVIAPNWSVTKKVMESFLPFVVLAGVYLYLFVTGITPEAAQDFSSAGLFARAICSYGMGSLCRHGLLCWSLDLSRGSTSQSLYATLASIVPLCRTTRFALSYPDKLGYGVVSF